MAEIKKKKGTDWSDTLRSMKIGEELLAPLSEKDFAVRRANYLKSTGKGEWSISTLREENKIIIIRKKITT